MGVDDELRRTAHFGKRSLQHRFGIGCQFEVAHRSAVRADEVMVVTTDAKDMASKLIALYDDRDRLEALSRDGQTLINKNNFSTEAVLKVIADNFLIELMSFFYELPRHHFIQGVGRSACRSE